MNHPCAADVSRSHPTAQGFTTHKWIRIGVPLDWPTCSVFGLTLGWIWPGCTIGWCRATRVGCSADSATHCLLPGCCDSAGWCYFHHDFKTSVLSFCEARSDLSSKNLRLGIPPTLFEHWTDMWDSTTNLPPLTRSIMKWKKITFVKCNNFLWGNFDEIDGNNFHLAVIWLRSGSKCEVKVVAIKKISNFQLFFTHPNNICLVWWICFM